MKKALIFLLALTLIYVFPVQAGAIEVTEAEVPVVLTVINTVEPISVTVPAALPISLVDGYVVTASNAKIVNNGEVGAVRVTGVEVRAGAFKIGSFDDFKAEDKTIALKINQCVTETAGALEITEEGFPVIAAGENLPIRYSAKVASSEEIAKVNAATVIFTIAAANYAEEG